MKKYINWSTMKRPVKIAITVAGGLLLLVIGIGIGASGKTHTITRTVAGPSVVKTVPVPGATIYKTKNVPVPGPTKYKTVYVPASQGPTGTTVAAYSGTGNRNTGTFNVPASGDYVVSWSYYGNNDCSLGSCQATNFSISNTGDAEAMDLPNDIQASSSGSTELTGGNGTDSFNVAAMGHWTITVKSAS